MNATENDIKRFMAKVEKLDNGCWYWTGARSRGKGNKKWYGSFHINGKKVRAHVFSSEVLGGKHCPQGYHRAHTCNFSMCVNDEHIEIQTREQNQAEINRRRNSNDK